MTANTVRKQATEIQVGDIIRAHGARFEVIEVCRYTDDGRLVQANISRWLDGRIATGYFGPGKTFNHQGTDSASFLVEVKS